jgi:hypothetical protein
MNKNDFSIGHFKRFVRTAIGSIFVVLVVGTLPAATENLGNGFFHHGVATTLSNHRGTVATVDGNGRDIVLVWLLDHRGGYALLLIDAQTGKSEQFPVPFPPGKDCPYASILSSGNKYYTHFNNYFSEFDPVKRAFTFFRETNPQMAMGMTEDDNGVIWSVTYPKSGVVSFNPKTREFRDYGYVYAQNWQQYQRFVAADDTGWIYFGLGNTASQIVAFDPAIGQAKPMLAEGDRKTGSAYLYRDIDGKVYGQSLHNEEEKWYEFYKGSGRVIGRHDPIRPKPIITGSQALFYVDFPDGKKIKECDLIERRLVIEDPKTNAVKEFRFEYTSEGAHIMSVAAAPDGTICGGTAFPMRFFSYDPKADRWINRAAYLQFNTVGRQGDRFFFGGYTHGFLLEWDPSKPWVDTVKDKPGCNPLFLTQCMPTINRPHRLLLHPDGKTVIMGGTPDYGCTGGGLLFWDREKWTRVLLTHTDIIPQHSTISLVPLPKGKLLGGTTTSPGTGGEKKAKEAELYIMDMASKKLNWHQVVFPGVQEYTDMCPGPKGLIYGIADRKKFFVFDAAKRKVVYEKDVAAEFGPTTPEQGPRAFVHGPEGEIYMLFVKGIARIEPKSHAVTMLAESPVPIDAGGDYLDGRIYFVSSSHLYSYKIKE